MREFLDGGPFHGVVVDGSYIPNPGAEDVVLVASPAMSLVADGDPLAPLPVARYARSERGCLEWDGWQEPSPYPDGCRCSHPIPSVCAVWRRRYDIRRGREPQVGEECNCACHEAEPSPWRWHPAWESLHRRSLTDEEVAESWREAVALSMELMADG